MNRTETLRAIVSAMEDGKICIFCGAEIEGYGNNPSPVAEEGKCCDSCNATVVIPARMKQLSESIE